jgi:hypothetical protein
MTAAVKSSTSLAAHAVCMAAGIRDSLRAAQYYVRDLSRADGYGKQGIEAPWLSSIVARLARVADAAMTRGGNVLISLLLPGWRKLPSPFTPGMMGDVAAAIRKDSLVANPLFNAYFFRAAIHIIKRYTEPPFLVLEHRVDAARRKLSAMPERDPSAPETMRLARILIALAQSAPVARIGKSKSAHPLLEAVEPNIAVCAIACATLLFAEDGKPAAALGEDEFFAVAGALIGPRLPAIAARVEAADEAGLAQEFAAIKALY